MNLQEDVLVRSPGFSRNWFKVTIGIAGLSRSNRIPPEGGTTNGGYKLSVNTPMPIRFLFPDLLL